ncbi:MAG: hypothetical protein LAN83_10105 [Acidobacteriia bacterium]|nr:hypothetical protein [Terriglobia bacterium]
MGSRGAARDVGKHLNQLKRNWLPAAAKDMAKAVRDDWDAWRKSGPS